MKKFGLFIAVMNTDVANPVRLRLHQMALESVTKVHLLVVSDNQEPRLCFVDRTHVLIEYLPDDMADITLSNIVCREVAQRPSDHLIRETIGHRGNTSIEPGACFLQKAPPAPRSIDPDTDYTKFTMECISWEETTNPEVLRYIFGSFPTALMEAELERRRVENEQEEQQDQHDADTWTQEQDEYDEHQRQELDRIRGRHK